MTALDVKGICLSGGNVVLNAKDFSPLDLKGIALSARSRGVQLIIKNARILSPLSCKGIALSGGLKTVTFDFSE